jgi:hypothetical protein
MSEHDLFCAEVKHFQRVFGLTEAALASLTGYSASSIRVFMNRGRRNSAPVRAALEALMCRSSFGVTAGSR